MYISWRSTHRTALRRAAKGGSFKHYMQILQFAHKTRVVQHTTTRWRTGASIMFKFAVTRTAAVTHWADGRLL